VFSLWDSRAQAVLGIKYTHVGANALNNPVTSRGVLVILPPNKGVAFVQYAMLFNKRYLNVKCVMQVSDRVVVTFHSSRKVLLSMCVPMEKYEVCTKLRSTIVTGVAAGFGG
jgi:hypothetical protein